MGNIKVIVVDDHPMVREGLKYIVDSQENMAVIDEADNGTDAINKILQLAPDVVLMDINMPVLSGIEAVMKLSEEGCKSKIIMITGYDNEVEQFSQLLDMGVSGYILKGVSGEELIKAIETAAEGEIYIQPTIAAKVIKEMQKQTDEAEMTNEVHKDLTKREMDVLKLIARGYINAEIAKTLELSEETIKNHVSRVLKKVGVRDRTNAAIYAIKHNIVDIEEN